MKRISTFSSLVLWLLALQVPAIAQTSWPKDAGMSDGNQVKMYQWEAQSLQGNTLSAKAAIAIREQGKQDLVFGMAWLEAQVERRHDQVLVQSAKITAIKIPGVEGADSLNNIQAALEDGLARWRISFASNDLDQQLQLQQNETKLAQNFNNKPPQVIYSDKPSLLVYIDGQPRMQENKDWGMQAVINTPFTIVKYRDGNYYLYGGGHWYAAPEATGPYSYIKRRPAGLDKVEEAAAKAEQSNNQNPAAGSDNASTLSDRIPEIVVSTQPAELIQTDGEANFRPINGTSLLYVSNSSNDIFLDMDAQQYYVLLAGRWYKSSTLKGDWQYIAANQLPADFARIPEGSPKDNVLASVAGTGASDEARLDAQVPQTARVDRRNTRAEVQYDGSPEFDDIQGLDVAYATNTASSVIRWRGRYYLVDNGIWFESYNATGPWEVCVERPYVVSLIPPQYPVYPMKYVYIYDVYPDYVYMGYTPGYLNTYVYGPTVVYGTGWYYRPWYRHYYFARPCTWGFGMHYIPWYGWSFGFNINYGWFNWWYGDSWYRPYYWGGWWGPYRYRPSYCWGGYDYDRHYRGYYGNYGRRNTTVINNYYYNSTNIYNNRNGVYSRQNGRAVYPVRNDGGFRGEHGLANNSNPVRFERDRAANFNNRNAFNGGFSGNNGSDRTGRPDFNNRVNNGYANPGQNRNFDPAQRNGFNSRFPSERNQPGNRNLPAPGNNSAQPGRSYPNSLPNTERERPGNPSRGFEQRNNNWQNNRSSPPTAEQPRIQAPRENRVAPMPRQESRPVMPRVSPGRSEAPPRMESRGNGPSRSNGNGNNGRGRRG